MQNWSLLDAKINLPPEQFAKFLRDKGDIFWWEKAKFWVITSHAYAKQILTSEDFTCNRSSFFVSRMPNLDLHLIQDFFAVVGKMMVMSDDNEHVARRRICYDGFTNQAMDQLKPLVAKTIEQQISQCKAKGHIELVEDIAKVVPSTILADFFHIAENERHHFYEWSNNMTQFFGGASQYRNEDGVEVNHSASSLRNYFAYLIGKRRENPQQDFLSILLKNQSAFGLTDDEIISQAIMMLVAGQVTTTDQLCNNFYTLMSSPEALAEFANEDIDIENALDELNRLDPAVTFIFRVTRQDTMIGQQKIKTGDVIFISTHAVNRDPNVFDQPNECILTRKNNKQLSYGFGSHYCIGAKLARIEMANCFELIFKHFPQLKICNKEQPMRKHHSLAFSGFERFKLVF